MKFLHSILCLLLLLSGFMVAFSVNPIESVLFLILAFFNAGAILIMFNAEFLGLIFIIVYVGAIAVLFLFVIMMLNVKLHEEGEIVTESLEGYAVSAFLIGVLSYSLLRFLSAIFHPDNLPVEINNDALLIDSLNNIDVLGQVLYNYYLVCFLVAGLILLVALVGAIILTLRFNNVHKSQLTSRQLSRTDNFLSFFN